MSSRGDRLLDFKRRTLAEQAAGALRDSIRLGVWGELLPSETELARRLSISRPTLRAALAQLAKDGLITTRKGARSRICRGRGRKLREVPPSVCVINLTRNPGVSSQPLLMEMRAQFATQAIGWEEVTDWSLAGNAPGKRLATLVHGRRRVCWLLVGCTAAVQRWFQAAHLPTLVVGTCHESVELPSVDIAYKAIGWHAAGVLSRYRHTRVALVTTQPVLAGDMECINGLCSYRPPGGPPLSVSVITAGADTSALRSSLDRVLLAPKRPTAIMSIHVAPMLTVLTHLLRRGCRVPEDVSLLCRVTDIVVDAGLPELTRYRNPAIKLAHQVVRIVNGLLAGNQLSAEPCRIMPAFVPGATVAAPSPGISSSDSLRTRLEAGSSPSRVLPLP